jgi:putative aldouronate transport system permease protein
MTVVSIMRNQGRRSGKTGALRLLRKDGALHLMLLVPVLFVLVYNYIPMAGLAMAFQKFKPALGLMRSRWVGLENFQTLFATSGFGRAVANTIIISVQKIVLLIAVPVAFSLLLNEMAFQPLKRAIQTVVYLPHFISWVIMSGIIIEILSPSTGLVNKGLGLLGIQPIFFLGSNQWFRPTLIVTSIWKNFGYSTIVYLAALTAVDPCLQEAAKIDGASHWKIMWHVTLPCILPTIILMATLQIGNILSAGFEQVFNLLSSITMDTGDIIDTLVYRYGLENAQYSIATAAGLFKSSISAVLMILSYRLAYRYSGYRLF